MKSEVNNAEVVGGVMMAGKEIVRFRIDGMEVEAEKGKMLLSVALEYGFEIPHLCYHESISPGGRCGLCVVEVTKEGSTKMTMSCKYPIDEGVEVASDTEKVRQTRRRAWEVLLARAYGSEVIHRMARAAGVEETSLEKNDDECILCGLCERVCREVVGANALTIARKDEKREVVPNPEACIACGACVYICPTDCIRMEENADERTIVRWNRTVKMQQCKSCGRPFAPVLQLQWIISRAHLPKESYDLCPVCRVKS